MKYDAKWEVHTTGKLRRPRLPVWWKRAAHFNTATPKQWSKRARPRKWIMTPLSNKQTDCWKERSCCYQQTRGRGDEWICLQRAIFCTRKIFYDWKMLIADNLQEKIVKDEDIFKIFYSSITFLSVDFWRRKRREKQYYNMVKKWWKKMKKRREKAGKLRWDEEKKKKMKEELLRINWQKMKLEWAGRGAKGSWAEGEEKGNKSRGGKW